jgi:hypothetical protein
LLLPGIEPFDALTNVRLGMPAEELMAIRTTVFTIPLFGYQDSVGKYLVGYNFPGLSGDAPPSDDDRLARVRAERTHLSDAAADSAFRARVSQISGVLGPPVQCLNAVAGTATQRLARWEVDPGSVYVEMSWAGGPPGTPRARLQPPATRTIVSVDAPGPPKEGGSNDSQACGAP